MTFLRIYINKICLKRSCWYHDVRVCDANSHHSITLWCAMCVFYYTFFWCLRVFSPLLLAVMVVVVVIVVFFYQMNGIESNRGGSEWTNEWEHEWQWKETKRQTTERNNNNHSWNIFPFLLFFSSLLLVFYCWCCFCYWCCYFFGWIFHIFWAKSAPPCGVQKQEHLIPRKNQIKAL